MDHLNIKVTDAKTRVKWVEEFLTDKPVAQAAEEAIISEPKRPSLLSPKKSRLRDIPTR